LLLEVLAVWLWLFVGCLPLVICGYLAFGCLEFGSLRVWLFGAVLGVLIARSHRRNKLADVRELSFILADTQ
jgi:hypothetical protein